MEIYERYFKTLIEVNSYIKTLTELQKINSNNAIINSDLLVYKHVYYLLTGKDYI